MKHLLLLLLFTAITSLTKAQVTTPVTIDKGVSILGNDALQKIDITLNSEKEISNLLVLVTDKDGQTIFLENLYRFKGDYKNSVDLKEVGKGQYSVKVVRDENIINQEIIIR
ncbi:MAG TPA: hypothetical protein VF868_07255 [Bacteroidia bacterium]|jgi:hypothetical protein